MSQPLQTPNMIWIKSNWFLVLAFVSVIGLWTSLNNRVDSHTDEIKNLKHNDNLTMSANNQIMAQLASIQTDIMWIKEKIR
jgi:hypothetical protein